jgi:hypothetical protein
MPVCLPVPVLGRYTNTQGVQYMEYGVEYIAYRNILYWYIYTLYWGVYGRNWRLFPRTSSLAIMENLIRPGVIHLW